MTWQRQDRTFARSRHGLDMDRLNSVQGRDCLVHWIKDRYLDVQVTQIERSLSNFLRKLCKKPGQAIRDYVGVGAPSRTSRRRVSSWSGWASELNLLASVGNTYDFRKLQHASIVQDQALRKPWETTK